MKSCWSVLGIKKTANKKEIRKAYGELVKLYHPEDEPLKYKEVREAYEQALFYVKYESSEPSLEQIPVENEEAVEQHLYNLDAVLLDIDTTKHKTSISEMEKLFQNTLSSIAIETQSLYDSSEVNHPEAWKQLFQKYQDHEELILETLLYNDLTNIHDERVVYLLQNIIEELPREDKQIYENRLEQLRAHLRVIMKSLKGHHFYSFIDTVSTLSMILAVIIGALCFFVYGFRALFVSNEQTTNDIFLFIITSISTYQLFYICERNMDKNSSFYFRSFKLLAVSVLGMLTAWTFLYGMMIQLSWINGYADWEYILLVEVCFLFIVMRKDFFLEAYNRSKFDVETFSVLAVIFNTCAIPLFLIFIVMAFISKDINYMNSLIYSCMMLYLMVNSLVLFNNRKYKGMYVKLQSIIAIIAFIGGINGCNFLFHMIGNPAIRNHSASHTICGGFLYASFFAVFFLMFALKWKRKRIFKGMFMLPYEEFVAMCYDFLAQKCEDGKELDNLNAYERAFYLIIQHDMVIQDEGFKGYFKSDMAKHYEELLDVLCLMKADLYVEVLHKACELIFQGSFIDNEEQRKKVLYESLTTEEEQLQKLFYDSFTLREDMELSAYQFAMEHKKYFPYKRDKRNKHKDLKAST